jgi:hypothetical protein
VSLLPKIKWNINQASLERIQKGYMNNTLESVHTALDNTATATANYIKENMILRGSPTGSLWHQIINDYRGNQPGARVDSGSMLQSVGSEVTSGGLGRFMASYGLPVNGEEYFMKQDRGFPLELPNGTIRNVPGMNTKERSDKFMQTTLRKEMLRRGFLKGQKDWRGAKVMRGMDAGRDFESAWQNVNARTDAQIFASRQNLLKKYERMTQIENANSARLNAFKNELDRLGQYDAYVKRYN